MIKMLILLGKSDRTPSPAESVLCPHVPLALVPLALGIRGIRGTRGIRGIRGIKGDKGDKGVKR